MGATGLVSSSDHLLSVQLGQSQPHDGAAAAAALQRVSVSVLAGHHRPRGPTGGADSAA